jgi:signal transduction histidine kinase/ligand-binding sensor domain-containing protein
LAALSLVLLIAAIESRASSLGPVFRQVGVVDGLPDSRVEAIVQDRHGYVWIGTQSGLVRHEGRRLHRLSHDPADPNALPGANIMSLHAHSDGTVWAAVSGQGAVRIGPDRVPDLHLAPRSQGGPLPHGNIWSITEDCQGRVWLAFMRGGVARYDPTTDTLKHFPQNAAHGLAERGFQMEVFNDSRCRIWLVQSDRVSRLANADAAAFEPVIERDRQAGETIFNTIGEMDDGTILVAQLAQLRQIEPAASRPLLEADETITGLVDRGDGWVLMSTYGGFLRWHRPSGRRESVKAIDGLDDSLPSNALLGILRDVEGGLWFSVARHGAAYLPPSYEAFSRFQAVPGHDRSLGLTTVQAVAPEPGGGALWLGSRDEGIQRLDLASGRAQWLHEYFDNPDLTGPLLTSSLAWVGDRLVSGWLREVRLHDPSDGSGITLLERERVDQGTFSDLYADGSEAVWVTTFDAGVFRVVLDTRAVEHFSPEGEGRRHLPEQEAGAMTRDAAGAWWLGGRHGVYRFDPALGFRRRIGIDSGPVLAMRWIAGELWVATDYHLIRWRDRDGELIEVDRLSLPGRLPGGRVFGIFEGSDEAIWLVLSNGLARYESDPARVRVYSGADGLAVSEFMRHAAASLPDGRLAIGGSRGLVMVDPARIPEPISAPPVHITGINAGEHRLSLTPGEDHRIELDHRSNSLSLDYLGLSYIFPDRIRYRLRLQGWDEDWVELVGQNRHFYSNLRPGDYRFRVQAATPEGLWNDKGAALDIAIRNPPWLSAGALGLYGLVLLGGAGAGWRGLRLARQRRREIQEARQKRALAEEQRHVVERLNHDLSPAGLACVVGEEIIQITGAESVWVLYRHRQLPDAPISLGANAPDLTRERFEQRRVEADGRSDLRVDLEVEGDTLATCLAEAGPEGFAPGQDERLRLLARVAGQALHNLLLLERVRALAERAEQASAAKSEFLATMSHEIRTPLHGVMGMVELLSDNEGLSDQRDLLATLRRSGRQLQRIIDDVLDISRIEAGRMTLEVRPFELPSLLEHVLDLHAPNAARKRLDLRLRMASDLPLLARGDPNRVTQVLGNLLSNAVKFTEAGGIELIAERRAGGILYLAVCDSGPGISAADRARLFEPFMQLDASITRSHSGSGLGLAICRRLVAAMNGSLELAEHAGRGSRFIARLPILEESPAPLPLTRLLDGAVVGARLDASTQRVLDRLARRWGFTVVRLDGRRPRSCTALITNQRWAFDLPDGWLRVAGSVIVVDVPFGSGRLPAAESLVVHPLRWPLVESRLIAWLLDCRLTGPSLPDKH